MKKMPPRVDLRIDDARWQDGLAVWAEAAAAATLAHLDLDAPFEISVLGCDDAAIAELNADFRDKPTPTNVLSWPSEERGSAHPGGRPVRPDPAAPFGLELGDIAISYDTCAAEAAVQGKPFEDHVRHLLVHGLLHLLGYDHENDADAELMEHLEAEVLASMGVADPYLDQTVD
jgi:probable rRNA maturation factor